MTKRIFLAICMVALAVFLAALSLIMGVQHSYFTNLQREQLVLQTELAAQGVSLNGLSYLENLTLTDCRITWVDGQGNVLFDSNADHTGMSNHLQRQEIAQALEQGWGESTRYSDTLMQQQLYYARRLPDGSVLRLSIAQNTVLTLLLANWQPICIIIAIALIASLVLAGQLSRTIVRPLNQLNLDEPLSGSAYDELMPLLRRIDSQQKQLHRKQEEFDAVTENMKEGLVLLSRGDVILSINHAAAMVLGITRNCIGKDILAISRSGRIRELLDMAHRGEHGEILLSSNGRDYQLDASPVVINGTVTGIVLLMFDVTHREQAEQLRREFTGNVSHELKTPLHTISGYAELMAGGIARPEDTQKFAENIYSEARRMIRLVEDILRLSQLDEGAADMAWEQAELSVLVAQAADSLEPLAHSAQVEVTLTGGTAVIPCIPQLVTTIVYNLCSNAIKYNHSGGHVSVAIRPEARETVLTVTDDGIGIPPEHHNRIFERFYRVDKSRSKEVGGTGLGLSIVKHAAMVLGAKLELTSKPGAGTTVTVRFANTQESR